MLQRCRESLRRHREKIATESTPNTRDRMALTLVNDDDWVQVEGPSFSREERSSGLGLLARLGVGPTIEEAICHRRDDGITRSTGEMPVTVATVIDRNVTYLVAVAPITTTTANVTADIDIKATRVVSIGAANIVAAVKDRPTTLPNAHVPVRAAKAFKSSAEVARKSQKPRPSKKRVPRCSVCFDHPINRPRLQPLDFSR
ncbi:hypothetical protein QBC42DRAFT_22994 [Cladorrhinum samala]|uniref:Uncharacterized protein n=1 Tax=Cladorrhinum samala TaxID=585594 RepID=A0AAV9HEQ7_9PEZI|nr:hypothetical protein QBC42DRAFT_22994 [Cladorrhinum samala]